MMGIVCGSVPLLTTGLDTVTSASAADGHWGHTLKEALRVKSSFWFYHKKNSVTVTNNGHLSSDLWIIIFRPCTVTLLYISSAQPKVWLCWSFLYVIHFLLHEFDCLWHHNHKAKLQWNIFTFSHFITDIAQPVTDNELGLQLIILFFINYWWLLDWLNSWLTHYKSTPLIWHCTHCRMYNG